jgi:hypothetical protein
MKVSGTVVVTMHRDPPDVFTDQLALAGVQSGADLQSQRAQSLADRTGAGLGLGQRG